MDLLHEKRRALGNHRPQVAAAMIGSAVVGGAISASASQSAADTQANAANKATDAQRGMFDTTVGLEAPFRDAGVAAQQKLSYLLGLSPSGGAGSGSVGGGAPAVETADQIRARLAPQFSGAPPQWAGSRGFFDPTVTFDQPGLDAAVQQELARQQAAAASYHAPAQAAADPNAGSLLKPFGMEDFQLDPGIQFQLKYGQQALQNSQAAQNGVLSGGALKGLIGFNQDYAGLGYQSAFDRYMANKSFTLGALSDVANRGQAAAGNTVNNAGQFSSGIANTITGAGNAQAAGTIGSANAITGGINGASNAYFLRNLLGGGGDSGQAAFSQTGVGGSGFGTGLAYGNQDYGQYL